MTPHQKNDVPYNQIDHDHCWRSKNPPCGQKIEHLKCCLCEKLNPRIEIPHLHQKNDWREEFDAKFSAWETDDEGIKSFIETLLTQQAERIAEEVERLTPFGIGVPQDPLISKNSVLTLIRTRNT